MQKGQFKDWIIQENDDYLAVNKPAGIASLHEREMDGRSLIELAKVHDPQLQLCHRLDKETSGVLLMAKHPNAYRHVSIQFERRKAAKIYHAVIGGVHQLEDVTIDLPLISTRSGRSKVSMQKGKSSQTLVNTLERFKHYTLIEARPITGRLHQIRAHLASQNAAIAADTLYGGKIPYLSEIKRHFKLAKDKEEHAMINRVALHAKSLKIIDLDDKELLFEADYPKDFKVFIKQLKKYDASTY